jgi:metal-responsive CopG/Arc/MetJ family transcriptional regulator
VRATIYLPDDLAQAVEAYFKEHPETSLSALVQEALRARLRRNPAALLELAGVVEKAKGSARERAEDRPNRQER